MNYKIWIDDLRRALERHGITGAEAQAVINYYEEIYNDKRESGVGEADILKEFGFPEDVAINVVSDDKSKTQTAYSAADEIMEGGVNSSANSDNKNNDRQGNVYTPPVYDSYRPARSGRGCLTILLLPLTLLIAFVGGIVLLVLIGVGMAIPLSGIAMCVVSFFMMTNSFGAFLIGLGSGIAAFGAGCLLMLCVINLIRAYFGIIKFGLGIRGGRA
ncbi:MAG: hypothetical protein K2M44_02150 [Clostridia bacterium]|nr:hypothetical protein [Clostridia bacterium]